MLVIQKQVRKNRVWRKFNVTNPEKIEFWKRHSKNMKGKTLVYDTEVK